MQFGTRSGIKTKRPSATSSLARKRKTIIAFAVVILIIGVAFAGFRVGLFPSELPKNPQFGVAKYYSPSTSVATGMENNSLIDVVCNATAGVDAGNRTSWVQFRNSGSASGTLTGISVLWDSTVFSASLACPAAAGDGGLIFIHFSISTKSVVGPLAGNPWSLNYTFTGGGFGKSTGTFS